MTQSAVSNLSASRRGSFAAHGSGSRVGGHGAGNPVKGRL